MKKKEILKWFILAIAIAINLFILINGFINGEASAKESDTVAKVAADAINTIKEDTITPQNFDKFAFDVRKLVGHFGLFAASGIFSTLALYLFLKDKKVGYFLWQLCMTFAFGFVVATTSEFAQKFADGRAALWTDVGIDMLGYFIGVLPVILILLIRKSPIFFRSNYKKNQTAN